MAVLNKSQVEIEVKKYKTDDKIKIIFPDEAWTKDHFSKADYNLRIARINFNLNDHKDFLKELEKTEEADPDFNTYEWVIIMLYYGRSALKLVNNMRMRLLLICCFIIFIILK